MVEVKVDPEYQASGMHPVTMCSFQVAKLAGIVMVGERDAKGNVSSFHQLGENGKLNVKIKQNGKIRIRLDSYDAKAWSLIFGSDAAPAHPAEMLAIRKVNYELDSKGELRWLNGSKPETFDDKNVLASSINPNGNGKEYCMLFDGLNLVNLQKIYLELNRVVFTSADCVDFLGDEFCSFVLRAKYLKDETRLHYPYGRAFFTYPK